MKKNNNTCCLVFTKNPIPGETKTRLIPAIGINAAYKVHIKLLIFTLELTSSISEIDFHLYYTSLDNNSWLNSQAKQYNLTTHLQIGSDLGERMFNAARVSLEKYSNCIIIGTDCPEMSSHYLLKAQDYLISGFDTVIGPAADGGYVLIGMKKAHQEIFTDKCWGESTVLPDTIKSCDKLALKYKKLAVLHDVDTKDDLQYLDLIPNSG